MLVNQILLVSDVSRQHICPKNIGQLYVPRQGEHHSLFFNSQERAVCHCASRGRARRLTSDGIFANKIAITQYVECNRLIAAVERLPNRLRLLTIVEISRLHPLTGSECKRLFSTVLSSLWRIIRTGAGRDGNKGRSQTYLKLTVSTRIR